MKARVLRIFSVVFYLLLACSILSQKIEKEMTTQVEIYQRTSTGAEIRLPLKMLFTDGDTLLLSNVIDGTGWNSGLRCEVFPSYAWSVDYVYGEACYTGTARVYSFIRSASRLPRTGDRAEIISEFTAGPDRYLALYEDGLPESLYFSGKGALAAQNDRALLWETDEGRFPYFEHHLKAATDTAGMASRIFSLTDVETFLRELPKTAAVGAIVIFALLLCIWSSLLSAFGGPKQLIWLHVLLLGGTLAALYLVLGRIDLPASLLPAENILQFSHYCETLSTVFETLSQLDADTSALFALRTEAYAESAAILKSGFLAAGTLMLTGLAALLLTCRAQRRARTE